MPRRNRNASRNTRHRPPGPKTRPAEPTAPGPRHYDHIAADLIAQGKASAAILGTFKTDNTRDHRRTA